MAVNIQDVTTHKFKIVLHILLCMVYDGKNDRGLVYSKFVKKYISEIDAEIAKLHRGLGCATEAYGLLLLNFSGNIKGAFNAQMNSIGELDLIKLEKKIDYDAEQNINYFLKTPSNDCVRERLKKFSKIVYGEMKIAVMDYAIRHP